MGNPPVNPTYPKDSHNLGSTLKPGMTMQNGDYLMSPDGQYRLQLENGQLIEYGPDGQKTWSKDVTEQDVGTEAGVSSTNTEDPNTTLSINSDNELQNNQGDGSWITLGNTRYNHSWGTTDYSLGNDGNFVGKQSDGTVNDSTGYTDKTPYRNETIVTPEGASDQLTSFISGMNTDVIIPLAKQFGSGTVKLQFTEETSISNAPSWVGKDLSNTSAATGTGSAHDAWQSALNYVTGHEQTWQKNDADLKTRLGQLQHERAADVKATDASIADCNQRLQWLAVPGGKAGSIKDESPAYSAINAAISGVSYWVGKYVDFSNNLAPSNAIWPDGGTGSKDTKASGSSSGSGSGSSSASASSSASSSTSSSTYYYNKGYQAGKAATAGTGSGNGTGSEGTANDANYNTPAASTATSTNYSQLFGDATDGATSGSGSSLVSSSYGNSYGSAYGATASSGQNSEISSLFSQLENALANSGNTSSGAASTENPMEAMALMSALSGFGKTPDANNGQGDDSNANSGDNGQNSNSSSSQNASSTQNASAATQDQPGTATPAAVTAPDAGTAPSTSGANHLVSVSLDGETQNLPSVVADAINKELNNPNGSNAVDVYTGTPGENTTGQPWQQIDDLSKLQTGDIVQWHDRSSLVVHDDKGLHMIVDGQIVPLNEDTTQSPPQDAYGGYGDFKGFFHPSGANLNSSANPSPVETAVPNPPAVTSTQATSTNPPPIAPPKQE